MGLELLQGGRVNHSHRKALSGGLHRLIRSIVAVAGIEGTGLVVRYPDAGGGGAQAPASHLCGTEEVPPTGVDLFVAYHTGTRKGN